MHLIPLTKIEDTENAFNVLSATLKKGEFLNRDLNFFRNGSLSDIYWHEQEKFWVSPGCYENRFSFVCGTDNPHHNHKLEIVVAINPNAEGINRRIAAAFLQDEQDEKFYLAHNGLAKGIDKATAEKELQGWKTVYWPDAKETNLIIVCDVEDKKVALSMGKFVHMVKSIKDKMK